MKNAMQAESDMKKLAKREPDFRTACSAKLYAGTILGAGIIIPVSG